MTTQQPSTLYLNRGTIDPVVTRFALCEETCEELSDMIPEFGFNGLGKVVFQRTYSRPKPDGTNEDWKDVVIRVINGVMSIRKDHMLRNSLRWVDDEWQPYAHDMAVSMFKMEWLPPGRGLWMMGTDYCYERGGMSLYNCCSRDTKFWTDEGIRSFEDFNDGDHVVVRGRTGCLPATVRSFGEQELWNVNLRRGLSTKQVRATANHRWLVRTKADDVVTTTSALSTGDYLTSPDAQPELAICGIGIQHGIVFGDGTTNRVVNNCQIRLCGDKQYLSKYFHTSRRENQTITGLPNTWKSLPLLAMNDEYILGFLAGWFATDGCVAKDSSLSISNNDPVTLEWMRAAFLRLGIVANSVRLLRETSPFSGKYSPCYQMTITHRNLPNSFFLLPKHTERFRQTKSTEWRVVSARPTGQSEVVWCVQEPEYEEFTLEDGILTKNCSATTTSDDIVHAAEWTMDCLMNGVGVGFDTSWRGSATIPNKSDSEPYVIADSREGWVGSLIALMCSYTKSDMYGTCKYPKFDYSLLRASGTVIAGFGGTSSGFEPLQKLHERVESYFDCFCEGMIITETKASRDARAAAEVSLSELEATLTELQLRQLQIKVHDAGLAEETEEARQKLEEATAASKRVVKGPKPYNHTRLVADIFNAIGACVVAGNVRRSAEIMLGDVDDEAFLDLKNYDVNPERGEVAWMSNNSVRLKANENFKDFHAIPALAKRIVNNGEPGMINLHNIQNFGRTGKPMKDKATLTNPCGEISLEDKEVCNLSEVFPPRCDGPDSLTTALEYSTFYSSTVSLHRTHREETNRIIASNRRIGVSISGIAQWASMENHPGWGTMNYTAMTEYLRDGYKTVVDTNRELAREAGVPESIKKTTVKPSGSISLLAGCTPGVHYPVSRYAIRRVRVGKDAPIVPALKAAGVPHEDDTYSDNTLCFEFAIDHGNVRPCEDVSPWEQFSVVAMLQRCFCDNSVSATVFFDKVKDGPDVEKMLALYIPILKSVSMLPHSGHGYAQAPYEPVNEETYEQRRDAYIIPDFSTAAVSEPMGSKFCSGDQCEL